ncbi:ECF RNA polymerase sigma factor SigL [bacterium BMS3Bbin02]|nr:ECF RNA polymerase sigma factor SigL [bacterium BMS3Bbin02]
MSDPRSDNELMEASRTDPAAFRVLYDRWARKMLNYFYRRTFDPHVSADLVAETFAIAWEKRHRFRDVGRPAGAWFYGIASKELSRYRRRRRVELTAVDRLGLSVPSLADDDILRIEEMVDAAAYREHLKGALEKLSNRERDSVRLRVVEGRPFSEVAEALGCSEGAARVRVHRALRRLGDQMGVER